MNRRALGWVLVAMLWLAMLPGMAAETTTAAPKGPDERIAFQRNEPPAVTVMFADGTSAVDLAPSRKFTGPCVTPALAPDGRTIAFSAKVNGEYKLFTWRLGETNAVAGEPKRLITRDSDFVEKFPSWSPDGKYLAFLGIRKDGKIQLCVTNAAGTGVKALATVSEYATPAWDVDGQQLLYIDRVDGNPTLFNIPYGGGKGLPVHPEFTITAATYSPDGKQIAAFVQKEAGVADLYLLRPFGVGGQAILKNIVGGKGLCWRTPDRITFNAVKVGAQSGKSFWTVGPDGEGLLGVTGYADPRQIAYFSVQHCDLTPYVPSPIDTSTRIDLIPEGLPDDGETAGDITDILTTHAITILSPSNDVTVNGTVPIKLIARKSVASIAILINGKFAYTTTATPTDGSIPKTTFNWNTQEFDAINPAEGIPAKYSDLQRYPDGAYTICAQALDAGGKPVDQHIITLSVENGLPASTLTGGKASLKYRYAEAEPELTYRVHGEGDLLGAKPGQADELNTVLDAAFRRTFAATLENGLFGYTTQLRGPVDAYALKYGRYQDNLPEFNMTGAYKLNARGELTVAAKQNYYAFLPLSQLAVPVPETAVRLGESWSKPMWVVTDLLDREATQVNATHRLDGLEWINGRRTARIRSDFRVENDNILHSLPSTTMPGARGTRANYLRQTPAAATAKPGLPYPGRTNPPSIAMASINADRITGVRYAWFDLDHQRLVRVEDMITYAIPTDNLPKPAEQSTTTIQSIPNPSSKTLKTLAWYRVRYTYTEMAEK